MAEVVPPIPDAEELHRRLAWSDPAKAAEEYEALRARLLHADAAEALAESYKVEVEALRAEVTALRAALTDLLFVPWNAAAISRARAVLAGDP